MNINMGIRAYKSTAPRNPLDVPYEYDFRRRNMTVGLVVNRSDTAAHQTAILRLSASRVAKMCCQDSLHEIGTFVKFIDYLTWNNRPCLMLAGHKTVFGQAAQQLHGQSSAKMSSNFRSFEDYTPDDINGIVSLVAFLDESNFRACFDGNQIPKSGIIVHKDSSDLLNYLRSRSDRAVTYLGSLSFDPGELLSCVTWGVEE